MARVPPSPTLETGDEYFASIVEASPDCIRILDIQGRVEFINAQGLKLFEIEDFERNQGRYWPSLWPEDGRAAVEAAVEAARSGDTRSFQGFCPTARGAPRWWDTTVSPVLGPDGKSPIRLLARSRDITEAKAAGESLRQALERAEAANQAKSDFLATMSHEVRTPLNGVLGMAQAMQADDLPPHQRERLKIIRRSGETLLAILNDLLDLSKIEAGQLELECAAFDMDHLVRGSIAAFDAMARRKGLAFGFVVDESARATFHGDAARIRRLLYSLLSNAVKFTERGEVNVSVAHDAGTLSIIVADTGVGIAADRSATMFESFVQGDASHTRRFGGSGLGLSICRSLAELMGGAIEVESALGEGSTFTVRLPLSPIAPMWKAGSWAAPVEAAPDPALTRCKVLAAEDNAANQAVLKTLLQQVGIDAVVVENGAKALAAWAREPWDVVLMDIQMPEMDGLTATRAIRAQEAASGRGRTPIIAVTANTMTHQLPEYAAAGMDDVVPKPLEATRLFAALGRVL